MNLTRADPVKLRHFVAVLDSGSFARAAEISGISQPAMSKSVRALEEVLGARLFERGRAGARPTHYAELLANHARAILAEYALAEAELRALTQVDQQGVSIGANLSLCQSLLPRAIARFRRRWPHITVSVEVGLSKALYAALLSGDLDLVLSAPEEGVVADAGLTRTFVLEEHDALVVGAGHPLLTLPGISIGDLIDYPWIVPRRSFRLDRIHAVFAATRLPPPAQILRSESADLALGLLIEEPFICLIGEGLVRSNLRSGQLARLPGLGLTESRPAYLATRRGSRLRPPVQNMSVIVQEVAKERPEGEPRPG